MRPFENEKRLDTRVRESVLWARLKKREALRKLKLSLVDSCKRLLKAGAFDCGVRVCCSGSHRQQARGMWRR